MRIKFKIIICTSIMTISLIVIGAVLFFNKQAKLPLIHGIVVPQSTPIEKFSILDHHNQKFSNDNLKGHWSLLSYGYTHCPDICPTTLNILNKFVMMLDQDQKFNQLQILFYSIDHRRDTTERLSEYMPFFNTNFVGLTHLDNSEGNKNAVSFEKSLGLISLLTPIEDTLKASSKILPSKAVEQKKKEISVDTAYTVGHGVMLYLINPKGNLQAVFKPFMGRGQAQYFTANQVYEDYIKIRKYFNATD